MNAKLQGSLVTLLTWVLVLIFFFPVFWMVLNGFKPESLASSINPTFIFEPVTEGYRLAMDREAGLARAQDALEKLAA